MSAIETKALTKRYRDKLALDGLDLCIGQGELFALLGVNGAGKSTAVKLLSCLIAPTSGEAWLMGHSILRERERVKAVISLSPQETAVAPTLRIGILAEGRLRTVGTAGELMARAGASNFEDAFVALAGERGAAL